MLAKRDYAKKNTQDHSRMIQLMMDIKVPVKIEKKARDRYVASCPVLDVFTQGETKEKARQNLIEALELFFTTCYEMGTLDDVLKECGLEPTTDITTSPQETETVDVPISFASPAYA